MSPASPAVLRLPAALWRPWGRLVTMPKTGSVTAKIAPSPGNHARGLPVTMSRLKGLLSRHQSPVSPTGDTELLHFACVCHPKFGCITAAHVANAASRSLTVAPIRRQRTKSIRERDYSGFFTLQILEGSKPSRQVNHTYTPCSLSHSR